MATLPPITKTHLENAFEAWEKGCRVNPEMFRTEEECRRLSVSQVSAERADYFFELLKQEVARG